jgi:Family of unknown function (DUF5908)
MPIEIRELIIRATVGEESSSKSRTAASSPNDGQAAIVNACVEKVLEILKEKNER